MTVESFQAANSAINATPFTVKGVSSSDELPPRERSKRVAAIKNKFQSEFQSLLNLDEVMGPLFVSRQTGLNDALDGVMRPVSFDAKNIADELEIVQSLAKWKRATLHEYKYNAGEGIVTRMNAVRRDEDLSPMHSFLVTQWDWEKVITLEQRSLEFLYNTVRNIFKAFKAVDNYCVSEFGAVSLLPEEISFITSQELEDMYPELDASERESAICREKKAVFVQGIGAALKSGKSHDVRAADYDDWNLNGDILLWSPVMERAYEVSSMGIRVSAESLKHQLEVCNETSNASLPFHSKVLDGTYPYTMGGGIGQCRVALYFTQCTHIGFVQPSVWDASQLKVLNK